METEALEARSPVALCIACYAVGRGHRSAENMAPRPVGTDLFWLTPLPGMWYDLDKDDLQAAGESHEQNRFVPVPLSRLFRGAAYHRKKQPAGHCPVFPEALERYQ